MFDEYTRPIKDKMLNPIAKKISKYINADQMTILSLIAGILSAAAILPGWYTVALWLWLINRLFDGLDGVIARATGTQTDRGGYLDIVCDFLIYAIIPAAIAFNSGTPAYYIVTIILLSIFYVNSATWMYLSALLEKRATGASVNGEPTSVTMPRSIIDRTETIVFYTIFLLLPQYYIISAIIMSVLTATGAVLRTRAGWIKLK